MTTATQTAQIRAALERGEALTPLDALDRFGCFRLGARIYELRKEGLPVAKRMVPAGDTHVAEYRLEGA